MPIGDVKSGDMVYASGLVDPDRVDMFVPAALYLMPDNEKKMQETNFRKRWISDHDKRPSDKDAKKNHICDSWFFRPSPFSRFEDRAVC